MWINAKKELRQRDGVNKVKCSGKLFRIRRQLGRDLKELWRRACARLGGEGSCQGTEQVQRP